MGFLLTLAGCYHTPLALDRGVIGQDLACRMGQTIPGSLPPEQIVFPPGTSLDDGLTEDEAIVIALWNNAAFKELLVDLGLFQSDLIQAGLLPNPEFLYYFQAPDKPFRYLLDLPIEAIWLRPIRVKSAWHETNRTAERLMQAGLDLVRDVRQAYADVLLAQARVQVAAESVSLRGRIADLSEKRLKAGDISEQEAATARIDSLQARQDAARIAYDVPVAEERLRNLLGLGPLRCTLRLSPLPEPACLEFSPNALAEEAMRDRPDAQATGEAIAAAEARLRFARLGWVRLLGILDATAGRRTGHEFGPALRFTVPVFNWNQGGISRAEFELERAIRNRETVLYQIILDVQRSYLQYRQACAELVVLRTKVRPEVQAAIGRAKSGYQEGNVTIFIMLETTKQLLDNYLREAQLVADLRRFWAELERSVGRRLAPPGLTNPTTAQPDDAKKSESGEETLPRPGRVQDEELPSPAREKSAP